MPKHPHSTSSEPRVAGLLGKATDLLDRLSLAGLDPYLRVGIAAALGGAVVGIAIVLALRPGDAPPEPTEVTVSTEAAAPERPQQSGETEAPRATLVLPDPAAEDARPLDEIPPQPVIERQPQADAAPAPHLAVAPESGDALIAAVPKANGAGNGAAEPATSQTASIAAPPKPPPAPVLDTNAPMVAIVIDDMGLDRRRSRRTVSLPGPLTLAYLTYAEDLPSQTADAAAAGHELMLHVAMEPMSPNVDPGPDVLLTAHDEAEILSRLRRGLDRFDGFVGINNHMGSKFTADTASLMTVMAELRRRDLFFLDSRTSAESVADRVAFEFGVPFAVRNVFLDDTDDTAGVARRLAETVRIAREQGHAIAIGHPKDRTLDALAAWIPTIAERGIRLVGVSEIIAALSAPHPQ